MKAPSPLMSRLKKWPPTATTAKSSTPTIAMSKLSMLPMMLTAIPTMAVVRPRARRRL